jgi:hypothetical protein
MPAKKKKPPLSEGIRTRLGRPVRDADDPIMMHLTAVDINRAKRKRRHYAVDEPDNFSGCALAECLQKMSGAEVLVMRRYAFVALPNADYTLRYQMDTKTRDIVKANDLDELGSVEPNVPVCFRPPTPGRRLITQGGPRVSKESRGIRPNAPKHGPADPYRGIYRHGVHARHVNG